jgi:MFS family permease
MHAYESNVRNYLRFRFFYGMLIIGPVVTPYLRFKGMSYTEIMWLQSISAMAVVLFEVPTGAIADKLSRRLSLVLAGTCIGTALIIYILTWSFWTFAVAEALFGLGLTFGSGADSALLYESLDRLGRKEEYIRVEGRTAAYIFAGQGVGSIISSLLYALNPHLPFWISVGSAFTAAGVARKFVETERPQSAHQYHVHILSCFKMAAKTPRILWTICLAALMGVCFRSAFWLYEPYFTLVHIEVVWFGPIFCAFNIVAALSAKHVVARLRRYRTALLGMGVLLACSFLLPALLVAPWSIAIISLQQVVRGAYRPTLNGYVNRQIKDENRATVISIISLAAGLSFACLSPLVGMSLDGRGAIATYAFMGAGTLMGIALLTLMRRAQQRRPKAQPADAPVP